MTTTHKNKTFAALLALLLGAVGAHRFYLRGSLDKLGLVHVMSVPIAGLVFGLAPHADIFYKGLPLLISAVAGCIGALVIGLMPDEKFDAAFNPKSTKKSDSNWMLALLMVATTMIGAVALIFAMARLFALLYTGGMDG